MENLLGVSDKTSYPRKVFNFKPAYHTAKTQYRKFETNIPRNGLRGLSPNVHIHVSVSNLYIPMVGLPILLAGKYAGRFWEYTNRLQAHELEIGTEAVQFLFWGYRNGIFIAVQIEVLVILWVTAISY
jgi:hypothetical protein